MATQIPERIADLPEPPYKGVDLGAVFISKAEGFRYELKYSFTPILNTIIGKVNIVSAEVSQNALNAEAYKNSSLTYRDESLSYRNTSLTYKTASELAYNNTYNLVTNLVIPTSATYTYNEADARFISETENFLNFKIGE